MGGHSGDEMTRLLYCRLCKQDKPDTEFSKHQRTCKPCTKSYSRAFRKRREKQRTRTCGRCKITKPAEAFSKLSHWCKECGLSYNRESKYGVTSADVLRIIESQNGVCLICLQPFTVDNGPCIDHCHVTNKVRGVLHKKCNLGLGHFNDDIQRLQNAIEYLSGLNTEV